MTLSSMVVSRDWQEVSVLECILGGLQMDVAIENEPQRALERLTKSKVDALIVDCDLNGSSQLLHELQQSAHQPNEIPLVIMGGRPDQQRLDQTGALFAFEKPICVEQAVRTLSAARNMILDGRLRYHRTSLDVPVSLTSEGRRKVNAFLVNVSRGGMQVRTNDAVTPDTRLQVAFELPGAKKQLKFRAEIAWQDKSGNVGVRFVKVAPQQQRTLQLWLAQQYFAN